MITLYTFGPAFGLPDPSPFVTKAHMLLKLAGLPYRTDESGFRKAPKGKLPYIEDEGVVVADSTFFRWHIEKKYGIDFDSELSPEQRGIPCATDATLFAFILGVLCPHFETPLRTIAEAHPNLVRYVDRMRAIYFQESQLQAA
jgi:glutathione S-transferase